ncbi:MAG: glycerophosphodiester phosphodiesterase [Solirubrobacteraceae bacterium]
MGLFERTPALCGHRGSGRGVVQGYEENTLASCEAAVRWGLRWLEIDCRVTADDVLVARHDPRLEDGRFVVDVPAAETGLLRIDELFEALPREIGIDLEVKTSLEDALRPREQTTAAAAADIAARERDAGRPLVLTSFDASVLTIAKERHPGLPTGLLTWTRFPLRKSIPAAVHLGCQVVAPQFASFPLPGTPAAKMERELSHVIDVAHRAGLEVVAWCPKPPEEALLAEAGADCIIVDDVLLR